MGGIMSSSINASTSGIGGIITTADASGILQLQTGGVTGITVDASQGSTFAGLITAYAPFGTFNKSNPASVAFAVTSVSTATLTSTLTVEIDGTGYKYLSNANVIMPTLTAGTDYAIFACTDGTIRADANFTAATGYTVLTSRKIGGFHYAPGGNAAAQTGGNTTPQINPYSFWDLKFKPNVADPRGMVYCGSNFWADIYLTNTNYLTNGTSKYNVAYACGTTPPLVSTLAGGTGSNSYTSFTRWEAAEVMSWAGKKLPTVDQFQLLAYGTTENTSSTVQDNSTIWRAAYVSKYGVNQVTGCLDIWGSEFGGGAQAPGWLNLGLSRGQQYQLPNAALLGGDWGDGANAGSRSSAWSIAPSNSSNIFGSRGVGDHLILV